MITATLSVLSDRLSIVAALTKLSLSNIDKINNSGKSVFIVSNTVKLPEECTNFNPENMGVVMTNLRSFVRGIKMHSYSRCISERIYFFYGLIWPEVVEPFRSEGVVITGGSTVKRHVLNPVHYRLAVLCHELGISESEVSEIWRSPLDLRMSVTVRSEPEYAILDYKTRNNY